MQSSHLDIYHVASDNIALSCQQLGYASLLMARSISHRDFPLKRLNDVIIPAIAHQRIKFFFNDDGDLSGYVAWAHLAKDVEDRFIGQGDLTLHYSEWNEGDSLWIIDFLIPSGSINYVLRYMRDVLFKNNKSVRYFRFKNQKLLIREITRNENISFFSKSI